MGRFLTWKNTAIFSCFIPAVLLITLPGSRLFNVFALLWFAVAGLFWFRTERRQQEHILRRTIKAVQSQSIRTMNHHRHDWMNDLQVLYGYIRLGKLERCVEYVERIKGRMSTESDISKLGDPMLITYLQSFRTLTNTFVLNIEIQRESDQDSISIDNESISEMLIEILNAYRMYAVASAETDSELNLEFYRENQSIIVEFSYSGDIREKEKWIDKLKQKLMDTQDVLECGPLNYNHLKLIIK